MNIAHCERPEAVFSSADQQDPASDSAKFFANPVQTENTYRSDFSLGSMPETGAEGAGDFNRFAFKALPVVAKDGLWFSAHLVKRDAVFEQAWAIYNASFCDFERRSFLEQRQVMGRPNYRFSAIRHADAVVGVLGYWQFADFCFVEHIAVSAAQRSGGFGCRALKLLQQHVRGPVVVDVEPFGTDQNAARRVAFYQRLGFLYCGVSVLLPPYDNKQTAPSNLMAWPAALDRQGREHVLETIGREVYGVSAFGPRHQAV